MPTLKTKFKANRNFTLTVNESQSEAKEVIQISADEVYESAEYFEKGQYLKQKHIDRFLANGVLSEIKDEEVKAPVKNKKIKDEK